MRTAETWNLLGGLAVRRTQPTSVFNCVVNSLHSAQNPQCSAGTAIAGFLKSATNSHGSLSALEILSQPAA